MKRKQQAAIVALLVLSVGITSLGLAVANGWIGRARIDAGRLEYAFRTAGGVIVPDLGNEYNYPLYGRIDKPGNATLPLVSCQAYEVFSQIVVGSGTGNPENYEGEGNEYRTHLPTDDILVIDYAAVLHTQVDSNMTMIRTAAISGLDICFSRSRGTIVTTGIITSFSDDHAHLTVTYVFMDIQEIDSEPWLVGDQRDVEVAFNGNMSLELDAFWSISVQSVDGLHEYYRSNRTLATWMFTPPDPANATSLPSVFGDFYCFWGSQALSVAASNPFYIDIPPIDPGIGIIGITASVLGAGVALVAWSSRQDRLERVRDRTSPGISPADEEEHL